MAGASSDSNPESIPRIWLCQPAQTADEARPDWLTPDEAQRLAGLKGHRRQEFLTTRWLIRQALAGASGLPASDCCPVPGRPTAAATPPGWHLSISHCQNLAACATGTGAVGIDIEPARRRADWQRVARRWFSVAEQDWLLRTDDAFEFLKVWTLKEAWLKATGRGIAGNLQTLRVSADFELLGDQQQGDWRASSCLVDGFIVTLVWQGPEAAEGQPAAPTLLAPPPDDCRLVAPEPLACTADWLLNADIHPSG